MIVRGKVIMGTFIKTDRKVSKRYHRYDQVTGIGNMV